jgi:microcystin-dependent protein
MTKKEELLDLINSNIKDNSKRVSSDKTTASMLKNVLNQIVGALGDEDGGDSRYHTKIKGEIKLYWGNYFDLPKGWSICDGSNGTPDLRGKVPVGWSAGWQSSQGEPDLSDYQHIGRMGGKQSSLLTERELPEHTHIATNNVVVNDDHRHKFSDDTTNATHPLRASNGITPATGTPYSIEDLSGSGTGSGMIYQTSETSEGSIDVNVTTTNSTSGEGESFENRQPYVVMMYIMYTGETVETQEDKVSWSEYDSSTGIKIKNGTSNLKYGFRYVSPSNFGSMDPSDYTTVDTLLVSNIGFIEKEDPARVLEQWLQITSLGDNAGDNDLTI